MCIRDRVRDGSAQSCILMLQVFQALGLGNIETAVLLAPAVVAHLTDADRFHDIGYFLALAEQNFGLTELGDDLLGTIALLGHDLGPIQGGPINRPWWRTGAGS